MLGYTLPVHCQTPAAKPFSQQSLHTVIAYASGCVSSVPFEVAFGVQQILLPVPVAQCVVQGNHVPKLACEAHIPNNHNEC